MTQNTKIAVVGVTGKSGHYLVQTLLEKKVYFKLLVRNPKNCNIESEFIEIVYEDISDIDVVRKLIHGCNAVISLLGTGIPHSKPTIFRTGTRN